MFSPRKNHHLERTRRQMCENICVYIFFSNATRNPLRCKYIKSILHCIANLYACKPEAKYLEEMEKMSNMEKQVTYIYINVTNMHVRAS